MRLPTTPQLSTKDGISNKNARLTNMLKGKAATGELAVVRPGLVAAVQSSGNGNGLVCFDGSLISVFGVTLTHGATTTTLAVNAPYDFAQSPL